MVRILELVLNYALTRRAGLASKDVNAEGANGRLGLDQLELNADGVSKHPKVGILGKPWSKVMSLVRPHVQELNLLELGQVICRLLSSCVKLHV